MAATVSWAGTAVWSEWRSAVVGIGSGVSKELVAVRDEGSVVVTPLERAGSRMDDDGESETTTVGETGGIDRGMGLSVDKTLLMSGAVHGETVSCCLLPSKGCDRVADEVVSSNTSGSSPGPGPVGGVTVAGTGSEC